MKEQHHLAEQAKSAPLEKRFIYRLLAASFRPHETRRECERQFYDGQIAVFESAANFRFSPHR